MKFFIIILLCITFFYVCVKIFKHHKRQKIENTEKKAIQESIKRLDESINKDWLPKMHSYNKDNESEKDDDLNYVNDLETYEIRTPGEPVIVQGYQLTDEEMYFTRYLSNEIQIYIPNAYIKLTKKFGPIIDYQILSHCQICRFQFNGNGKKLQVLSQTDVYWYDVKSVEIAIKYIPRIVKYAMQLSYGRGSKIWNPFSNDISHINLYYNCCYTLEIKEEIIKQHRADSASKADKEQFERYKNVLGDDCPATLIEFLDIKYDSPEDWNCLKSVYRKINRKRIKQYEVDKNEE